MQKNTKYQFKSIEHWQQSGEWADLATIARMLDRPNSSYLRMKMLTVDGVEARRVFVQDSPIRGVWKWEFRWIGGVR